MATITIEDLLQKFDLNVKDLKLEIEKNHFLIISQCLSRWKVLALRLEFIQGEVTAIVTDKHVKEDKKLGFLERLKQKLSFKATYELLLRSLLEIVNADDSCNLCTHLKQGVVDTLSHSNGSADSTPAIRLDSASDGGSGNGTSSPFLGHSQSTAAGGGGAIATFSEQRGPTGSFQMAGATVGGVQMRNEPSTAGPRDSVRRSRNLENKVETLARLFVSQITPPPARKAQAPPDVPMRCPSYSAARSQEDLNSESAEDVDDYDHDQEYNYIDPLEKEWTLATVSAELDTQLRLIAMDSTLLDRKDFMHGYTGLHWAAKHGHMDILSMLLRKGAVVDIQSNGLTPLHLAAQAGHEQVILKLVTECAANINLREHGGRRPIDMLNNKVSYKTKVLLSNINNYGLPIRIEITKWLCTFTQPRDINANLERVYYVPEADVSHGTPVGMTDKCKSLKRKTSTSPRSTIHKSFSFNNHQRFCDQISRPKSVMPASWDIKKQLQCSGGVGEVFSNPSAVTLN